MSSSSLPGDRERPAAPVDPVAAQIEAEFADHLATSTERLTSQGASPGEAGRRSQEKFGDAAAIGRRCWWIQQGDALMFRVAVVSLIVVLCLALAITTLGSWQSQSRMADQMNALSQQLKALAERPEPAPAVTKPAELKGKLFVNSADRPAAGAEVLIARVDDGEIVRRVTTDARGEFQSGPLPAGDYSVLSKLQPKRTHEPFGVQSAPVYVYPGVDMPPVELDVAFHYGRLQFEPSRPLPKLEVAAKYTIESRLFVRVFTKYRRWHAWTPSFELPPSWPAYVRFLSAPKSASDERPRDWFWDILSDEDLADPSGTLLMDARGELPEGQAIVAAALLIDMLPSDYQIKPIVFAVNPGKNFSQSLIDAAQQWRRAQQSVFGYGPFAEDQASLATPNDDFMWATRARSTTWLEHLRGGPDKNKPLLPDPLPLRSPLYLPDAATVPIQRGQLTRLRVEIPEGLETQIRELVDATPDPANFEAALPGLPLFTELKVVTAGSQPLPKDDGNSPSASLAQ
jgi:hypothetical protein